MDRTLLNHLLRMFTTLGMYGENFKKPFLEGTSEFYASEGVRYMQQSNVPDYLKHVEASLHEEHERCMLYLDASTRKSLILFEHLVNLRQNRPIELIDKFLDEKLQDGNKGTSEEELANALDKVLVLFKFIQGKDVFEAFYKKGLAKRLLLRVGASIDAEKSTISKLMTRVEVYYINIRALCMHGRFSWSC